MPEQPTAREAELVAKLARATAEIQGVRTENKLLREKLDALLRRLCGAQSEKLDAAQLLLMLPGCDEAPKSPEPVAAEEPRRSTAASPPRERGPRWPAELPVVEQVIDPDPVKGGPEAWRCIGEEVTEQLDYEPARFFKRRIVRRKFVRRDHPFAAPIIAPLHTLQDRCIAAPGLIAAIVVGKFCDHLPLYRQEQIFATRPDVQIPRQSLAQWMGLAAEWLRAIYEHIRTGVLGGGYVQVDETPIEYLDPGNGETRLGYLWACARPGGDTVFTWHVEPCRNLPGKHYSGRLPRHRAERWLQRLPCVRAPTQRPRRRRSHRAGRLLGARAARIFRGMRRHPTHLRLAAPSDRPVLYRIESALRACQAGPRLREAVRAAQSAPILRRSQAALELIRGRHLPQSAFGKAITYTLDLGPALEIFATDGRIEIDKNGVENAIRPTAIGKKNGLFFGAAHAGERGAILYTSVESCRRRGIDPIASLRDVLTRLPSMTTGQIPEVTPEAWTKARRQGCAAQAAA